MSPMMRRSGAGCSLMSVGVANTYALTFGIGSALAGAAGAMLAMTLQFSPIFTGQ